MTKNKITTQEMLERCVETQPKTLLNIGVGPLQHNEAEVFKAKWPEIKIVGLEPNPDTFTERVSGYPGKIYPWGLWSVSCLKTLTMVKEAKGKSSMLEPDPKWKGRWSYKNSKVCRKEVVSCVTLDQLDKALKFPKDIFLWMDIEGAELEALKGGHELLKSGKVKWIDLEIGIQTRRVKEPSEDDISLLLKKYGFSVNMRYSTGSHFGNVVYTR